MNNLTQKQKAALWWGILLLLLAAALTAMLIFRAKPAGSRAKIICGDAVEFLSLEKDGIYRLKANPNILFEIKDGAIRFIEADCPDKICEKAGFLSKMGETAACLPRETVLVIVGGNEGEADTVAG